MPAGGGAAEAADEKRYFRNELSMFCWLMFEKMPAGDPVSNYSLIVIKSNYLTLSPYLSPLH